MLVLKRKEGQWIYITHASGDVLKFRVYNLCSEFPGRVDIAFDDDDRNFEIQRPEREAFLQHQRDREAGALRAAGDEDRPSASSSTPDPAGLVPPVDRTGRGTP